MNAKEAWYRTLKIADAIAKVTGKKQYEIVYEAVNSYLDKLDEEKRQKVKIMLSLLK